MIASDRVAESSIVSACFRSFFHSVKKLAPGRLVFQRLSIQLFLIQFVDVCCRIVVLQGYRFIGLSAQATQTNR